MFELQNERTELLEKIEELFGRKRYAELRDLLLPMEAADIASLCQDLDEKVPVVFRLLPKELAAEVFGGRLLLEQLVGQIGGGQYRRVHAADPAGGENIRHFFVHQRGHLLHVGGAFLAYQSVICAIDGDVGSVCHLPALPSIPCAYNLTDY